MKPRAEVEHPTGFIVSIAALGTFVYFAEIFAYSFLVFADQLFLLNGFVFNIEFPLMLYIQIPGLVLTITGYLLFMWSVIARGKYAVSWAMRDDHKLVTWGPYRYVRHPSYLAYFFMFIGFFLIWPNLFALVPSVAIPCYSRVTFQEEELLIRHFGIEYREYQKKTGRFIPRF
jgi:protein-S-isoprenylcysteine O-methyltransferase Ste14